jgi:hypothetical protein
MGTKPTARTFLIWAGLAVAVAVPVTLASVSPYLAWREPIYIIAGFAGILALAFMLFQPLMAACLLPGLGAGQARVFHRRLGAAIVLAVSVHVVGLWITSPPDVVDALLFRSPTPFSIWGVIAMWAIFATTFLAATRHRFKGKLRAWRIAHSLCAVIIVAGTVIHAALIEGTMETISKFALSALVVVALGLALRRLRVWVRRSVPD